MCRFFRLSLGQIQLEVQIYGFAQDAAAVKDRPIRVTVMLRPSSSEDGFVCVCVSESLD